MYAEKKIPQGMNGKIKKIGRRKDFLVLSILFQQI
jgi:hypothetical protein